jgi:hypothetical protein
MPKHRDGNRKISSTQFYGEFHGHRVKDLVVLYDVLRSSRQHDGSDENRGDGKEDISVKKAPPTQFPPSISAHESNSMINNANRNNSLIWTAGDSSLDNKYWFYHEQPAVPGSGYDEVLDPPVSNADVVYWLNYLLKDRQRTKELEVSPATARNFPVAAINTAVEATTLNERTWRLRPQDKFLRDHLQPDDVLIVSVGGNDVAMAPTPCTACSVLFLTSCVPEVCLEKACVVGTVPCDDYCFGCGPSFGSCACAFPPCFGYMVHLFGTRVRKYVEKLTTKTRPSKTLVLMIYFPDETPSPTSWAGPALSCLGYDRTPQKLQMLIRRAYIEATSNIALDGTEVIPVPLFQVLDGTDPNDYVERVEPSSQGGRKIAELLLDLILDRKQNNNTMYGSIRRFDRFPAGRLGEPVESSYIAERD